MFDFNLLPFFASMLVLTLIVLGIGVHFYRNALVMFVVIPVALFCAFSREKAHVLFVHRHPNV